MRPFARQTGRRARGFTLVEVIVAISIMALLATMIITFFDSPAFKQSNQPIQRLNQSSDLQTVLENVTYDYDAYFQQNPTQTLKTWRDGHIGSGSGSPRFAVPSGLLNDPGSGGVLSGSYWVVDNRFVKFSAGNAMVSLAGGTPKPVCI